MFRRSAIIKTYNNDVSINKAFKLSALMNIINTKNLNITGEDMRTFNIMLNYLYQTTKISVSEERMDYLRKNALAQNGLWKFGVSGDRPIISVEISDISDMSFVFSILKAFEYYKNNSIFVDIIIINNETSQYAKIIKKEIDEEMYRMYTLNSFYHTPGSITVIDASQITREERRKKEREGGEEREFNKCNTKEVCELTLPRLGGSQQFARCLLIR